MDESGHIVIFSVENQRYALPLSAVDRVVRAVEVTPLPEGPDVVCGAVNVQGRIIPVINLRRRLGLDEREILISDQFIIARASKWSIALIVDSVNGVISQSGTDVIDSNEIVPGMKYIEGVVKFGDEMVMVHNLERLLSLEEERALEYAITRNN